MKKDQFVIVIIYFLIAFGLTFAFNKLPKWTLGQIDLQAILCGWGPLLSGLICYQMFKLPNQYRISFEGIKPYLTWSVVLSALLLPLLTISSVSKTTILASIISQFIYSLGEEFGWRHYLQNATYGSNKWGQYLLIGCLWFFWHYSFTNDPVQAMSGQRIPALIGIPLFIIILSLFSFIWGDLVIKTRSILLPTVAHYIPKAGDPISVGIIVSVLILIQLIWNRQFGKQAISAEAPPFIEPLND